FVPLLPGPGQQPGPDAPLSRLTDRERAVFTRLAAGLSNREIASELHLSHGTVKVHVGRILAKLHLRDRVQAVVLAYESGLIKPGPPCPTVSGAPRPCLAPGPPTPRRR